jgi:uncharacterized PurR-regulated membrane protein YhhQ (DUF165 family)
MRTSRRIIDATPVSILLAAFMIIGTHSMLAFNIWRDLRKKEAWKRANLALKLGWIYDEVMVEAKNMGYITYTIALGSIAFSADHNDELVTIGSLRSQS